MQQSPGVWRLFKNKVKRGSCTSTDEYSVSPVMKGSEKGEE